MQYPRKRTAFVTTFFECPKQSQLALVFRGGSCGWRHTGRIGNLHTQNQHKSRVIRPREIITDKPRHLLVQWDEAHAERPGYVGEEEEDDEYTAFILETIVEIDAGENGESNYGAIGDLIQL